MKKSKFKSHLKEALQTYLIEDYIKLKESKKSLFEKSISNNRFGVLIEQEEDVPLDDAGDEDMGFEDELGDEDELGAEDQEIESTEVVTDKPYEDLAWLAWLALQTNPSTLDGNEFYKKIKEVMGNARTAADIEDNPAQREQIGMTVFTLLEKIFNQNRI